MYDRRAQLQAETRQHRRRRNSLVGSKTMYNRHRQDTDVFLSYQWSSEGTPTQGANNSACNAALTMLCVYVCVFCAGACARTAALPVLHVCRAVPVQVFVHMCRGCKPACGGWRAYVCAWGPVNMCRGRTRVCGLGTLNGNSCASNLRNQLVLATHPVEPGRNISVWLDIVNGDKTKNWEDDQNASIRKAAVFMPLISDAVMQRLSELEPDKRFETLREWDLAIDLHTDPPQKDFCLQIYPMHIYSRTLTQDGSSTVGQPFAVSKWSRGGFACIPDIVLGHNRVGGVVRGCG